MSAQIVNSGRVNIESRTNLADTTVPFFYLSVPLLTHPLLPTHSFLCFLFLPIVDIANTLTTVALRIQTGLLPALS